MKTLVLYDVRKSLIKIAFRIYGIWFFDAKECQRVGTLVTDLMKKVQNEPLADPVVVEAVTSATITTTSPPPVAFTHAPSPDHPATVVGDVAPPAPRLDSSVDKHGIMKDIIAGESAEASSSGPPTSDIMALLSKAQREYEGVGGVICTDPGLTKETNDDNNNPDPHPPTVGAVSISVSSLFATAKGRRLTQGDLSDENHLVFDGQALDQAAGGNNNQDNQAVTPRRHRAQSRVAPAPDVKSTDSATHHHHDDDVLQSFVRKMNISGLQSLDPSALTTPSPVSAFPPPHAPPSRPTSLALSPVDPRRNGHHHSASVSSENGHSGSSMGESVHSEQDPPTKGRNRSAPSQRLAGAHGRGAVKSQRVRGPGQRVGSKSERVPSPSERHHGQGQRAPAHSARRLSRGDGAASPAGTPPLSSTAEPRQRHSVPSFSPPSCKRLPPIPAHFTSSIGSGLASASSPASGSSSASGSDSSPPPSVFGGSITREVPLLTPSAFETDSLDAHRQHDPFIHRFVFGRRP